VPDPSVLPKSTASAEDARSDADLVRAMASGDSGALSVLWDRYAGAVYTLCQRIVHSKEDADELLVDIFWEAWNRSKQFDPSRGSVFTFLMTLTRSRSIDRKRKLDRTKTDSLDATDRELPGQTEAAGQGAMLDEAREAVRKSLAGLEENQRRAIEYSFWDDLSHSDIAVKLGKPLGTVKTWIRQGMLKMREALGRLT
jgi:RNA polymerase sigma-70 factor (ECF subfamily)